MPTTNGRIKQSVCGCLLSEDPAVTSLRTLISASTKSCVNGSGAGPCALVVSLHHVFGEPLEQRLARAGGADAARAALDAQVLQHQRLQLVVDLRHSLDGLRTVCALEYVIETRAITEGEIFSFSSLHGRDGKHLVYSGIRVWKVVRVCAAHTLDRSNAKPQSHR